MTILIERCQAVAACLPRRGGSFDHDCVGWPRRGGQLKLIFTIDFLTWQNFGQIASVTILTVRVTLICVCACMLIGRGPMVTLYVVTC